MKKTILILISILLVSIVYAQKKAPKSTKPTETPKYEFKTMMDSVSYTFGVNIGKSIQRDKIDITLDLFFKGIKDQLNNSTILLSDQQMASLMQRFQQFMMERQQQMQKELADKNLKDAEKFLEENKKKEGIITTASGLQYKIITKGNGKIPTAQDTVVAHYRGTLIDGTEFDNSFKRNEPATFPVSGVIKGWQEVLQLMPVGSKWEVYIPPQLAYGEQGAGQVIPPNAALIFDIELISIK
ncbi:MAG TPA: FKBP-type peptidyl-prolyl cis-trans isomerase [Bacteroidota bacterium]|nr:FKBP-type peptidyl-prolyl cis-trans isomerase [Bacteroidota bacterium]